MCFLIPVLMWGVFFDINEKHATKKGVCFKVSEKGLLLQEIHYACAMKNKMDEYEYSDNSILILGG